MSYESKPDPGGCPNARALRALMEKHHLTYANVAALCGRSVKAVERWLATEGTASYSRMPDHALTLLRLTLKAQPKKRATTRRK